MTAGLQEAVTLPAGVWLDGAHQREAVLRPITGQDELLVGEAADTLLPARLVTMLLARCLLRLGPLSPVGEAAVAALTVGDREALLLHLRRLSFGDRLDVVLDCPAAGCGQRMDLALSSRALTLAPYPDPRPIHELEVETGTERLRLRFRLPSGADQDAAALALLRSGPEAAVAALLERTVVAAHPVSAAAAAPLTDRMAELDPQAEIMLSLRCPACGAAFTALFDSAAFLLAEMRQRARRLFREIHVLARAYHWSERAILALSAGRRRVYLDLLATEATG